MWFCSQRIVISNENKVFPQLAYRHAIKQNIRIDCGYLRKAIYTIVPIDMYLCT